MISTEYFSMLGTLCTTASNRFNVKPCSKFMFGRKRRLSGDLHEKNSCRNEFYRFSSSIQRQTWSNYDLMLICWIQFVLWPINKWASKRRLKRGLVVLMIASGIETKHDLSSCNYIGFEQIENFHIKTGEGISHKIDWLVCLSLSLSIYFGKQRYVIKCPILKFIHNNITISPYSFIAN